MLPSVTAIMLVDGRHQMVQRAVQSFMAQTYPRELRYLLIWDTGDPKYAPPFVYDPHGVEIWHRQRGKTIGALRNDAISEARGDVIVTFDSDDISSERRIEEQVALLIASKADACGFRECLFWDSRPGQFCGAWIYRSPDTQYAIGASLAFWRNTWERVPFADINVAEDWRFTKSVKTLGVSGFGDPDAIVGSAQYVGDREPRIICGIHGSNTADYSKFSAHTWKRASEWDEYCRERMAL